MVLNVVYVPHMQHTQKLNLPELLMTENVKISLTYAYLLSSAAFIPSSLVLLCASKNTVCTFGGW